VELYMEHRFDLLGSGWVQVKYGIRCTGLEGVRFDSTGTGSAKSPEALAEKVNESNRAESRRILQLLDADYAPIDWQLDFKSGYRWAETTWYADIRFGDVPGADVKLPWELSRLQHLPQLAVEFGSKRDERLAREFRNQVLDWIAMNPPRFGVNWASTMDVAIRAVNLLIAYDLFRSYGATWGDDEFPKLLRRSISEHASHISENLEWSSLFLGNHFLADVAGLAFCAAYLPPSSQTETWLRFVAQELHRALDEQFHPDGSNFEASTSYHRLSAEMLAWLVALLARDARIGLVPADAGERISQMAEFTRAITKPNGLVHQVGDNDSGRLLKLRPPLELVTVADASSRYENLRDFDELASEQEVPVEISLDHSDFLAMAGLGESFDALVQKTLSAKRDQSSRPGAGPTFRSASYAAPQRWSDTNAKSVHKTVIALPMTPMCEAVEFPDFGLYVFRASDFYLAVRCGSIGQRGIGGHAHNDQLAIELNVNGEDWIADPGTYLYTPLPARRNQYRSVTAHFAPQPRRKETGRLDRGLFRIDGSWKPQRVLFSANAFIGEISHGDSRIRRSVTIDGSSIVVLDESWNCKLEPLRIIEGVPFSPGYGVLEKNHSSVPASVIRFEVLI
jgi:hypothetical protein